jgi:hypothetical protein
MTIPSAQQAAEARYPEEKFGNSTTAECFREAYAACYTELYLPLREKMEKGDQGVPASEGGPVAASVGEEPNLRSAGDANADPTPQELQAMREAEDEVNGEPEDEITGLPCCALCGEPMPPGEEMFKYHGYSGPCLIPPKSPNPDKALRVGWISVKERQPGDGIEAGKIGAPTIPILVVRHGRVEQLTWHGYHACYRNAEGVDDCLYWADDPHITHWMPLPEPPTKPQP